MGKGDAPAAAPADPTAVGRTPSTAESLNQQFELVVTPNMKPGGKYKIPIPGQTEKVTIAVPPDAKAGQVISFKLSQNWIDTRNKLKAAAAFSSFSCLSLSAFSAFS